ncbi:MAG: cytochrome c [Planctomycetota bacterium]
MSNRPTNTLRLCLAAFAAFPVAAGLAGCRGERSDAPPRQFFPDMDDQQRWYAQGESEFFTDGRMMRPRVAGTVAFGRHDAIPESDEAWAQAWDQERSDMLRASDEIYRGVDGDGEYVTELPVAVDRDLLELGQKNFNIYCAACHGYVGDGNGTVGAKWSYPLPDFHAEQYQRGGEKGQDGYIWKVAREGVYNEAGDQKMPGYSHALTEHEAWAVVAYLRVLQASQRSTIEDVPEAERESLLRRRAQLEGGPAPVEVASSDEQGISNSGGVR